MTTSSINELLKKYTRSVYFLYKSKEGYHQVQIQYAKFLETLSVNENFKSRLASLKWEGIDGVELVSLCQAIEMELEERKRDVPLLFENPLEAEFFLQKLNTPEIKEKYYLHPTEQHDQSVVMIKYPK